MKAHFFLILIALTNLQNAFGYVNHMDDLKDLYNIWRDNCHSAANSGVFSDPYRIGIVVCGGRPENRTNVGNHTFNYRIYRSLDTDDITTTYMNWGRACGCEGLPDLNDSCHRACVQQGCGAQYDGRDERILPPGQYVESPSTQSCVDITNANPAFTDAQFKRGGSPVVDSCEKCCEDRTNVWANHPEYATQSRNWSQDGTGAEDYKRECKAACRTEYDGDPDKDGIQSDSDNCPDHYNPSQEDMDHDGIGDVCDNSNDIDYDYDGIEDAYDNCPTYPNSGQEDSDGDGVGDVCDSDQDGDGVDDSVDNCPATYNPGQENSDGDNSGGDDCDSEYSHTILCKWVISCDGVNTQSSYGESIQEAHCKPDGENPFDYCRKILPDSSLYAGCASGYELNIATPTVGKNFEETGMSCNLGDYVVETTRTEFGNWPDLTDPDGDGVPTANDNAPLIYNPRQEESDGDGIADVLDTCPNDPNNDVDGDGICGDVDFCPNDAVNDTDSDGLCDSMDFCPYDPTNDADGDGTCGYQDYCPYDRLNDIDGDGICGDVDPCPYESINDPDGDGICGYTVILPSDSDWDGIVDSNDLCPYDPTNDADGDGICGYADRCANDPLNDVDGDNVCGDMDFCPYDYYNDRDNDGLCDSNDNCPDNYENDPDGDGTCGYTQTCGGYIGDDDRDQDGICSNADMCPDDRDNDIDQDGLCANQDPYPYDSTNCPTQSTVRVKIALKQNPGQVLSFEVPVTSDACAASTLRDMQNVQGDMSILNGVLDSSQVKISIY